MRMMSALNPRRGGGSPNVCAHTSNKHPRDLRLRVRARWKLDRHELPPDLPVSDGETRFGGAVFEFGQARQPLIDRQSLLARFSLKRGQPSLVPGYAPLADDLDCRSPDVG